jgi:hypothetical protein
MEQKTVTHRCIRLDLPLPNNLLIVDRATCREHYGSHFGGGLLVLGIGYAVLIPLKTARELPPEMTWMGVILGPLLIASLLPASILTSFLFPRRQVMALSILALAYFIVVIGIRLLDSEFAT